MKEKKKVIFQPAVHSLVEIRNTIFTRKLFKIHIYKQKEDDFMLICMF